jgi:hypothetical protein
MNRIYGMRNPHYLCRFFAVDNRKGLLFVPVQVGTVLWTAPGFGPGKQDRHTRLNPRAPNGTVPACSGTQTQSAMIVSCSSCN